MASSGSFKTGNYQGRYLLFSWEETSQSIESNTTSISWTLKGAGAASVAWYKSGNFKLVIDGKTVYSTGETDRIKLYDGTMVASGVYTFAHNNDGTRSFTASAEAGIYTYAVNCTGSGTFTLDTIARASQPSLVTYPETTNNVGDFGESFGIHMNRKSSAFTHTVRYEYGERSGVIARDVENGVTWAVPLEFMNDIPNATSGSGRIYVDTYNGSTFVGTKYTGFTATVPASVKPSCSFVLEDVTGVDDIYGSPVKGLSKIKITVTAKTAYSSPIASYEISANGVKYATAEATTDFLKTAGTSPVLAKVTDTRGRSGSHSYNMTVQDYTAPAITALAVRRCDEDGTINDRGEFVKVTFSAAVSSMNSKNTATYTLRYKRSGDSDYEDVPLTALKNKYAVSNATHIFPADGNSSYDVEIAVADRHGTDSRSTSASTAFTLINWNPEGNGIRFGGVSSDENTFQNDLKLKQTENSYCFHSVGDSGAAGYVAIAQIEITKGNANAPITFCLARRNSTSNMTVHVRFGNVNTPTPGLYSITYEGQNYGAFLCKKSDSVWTLYVEKTSQDDPITLQKWTTSMYMDGRIRITFPGEQVETLPAPFYRATPAVLNSIIDCLLPVGMIIQLYSHADPNTMYPGTTWVRMANTFLWGCDASGLIGQTGGEKTHTLTVNEIPAHSHGSVYSQHASGTKDKAWYSTSGSSVAYGAVETGGDAAHNNMPPYTQVAIWRRTA